VRVRGVVMARPANTTFPGVGLVIAGVINLLYAMVYGLWTSLGLLGGGLVAVSQVMAATGVTQAKTDPATVVIGIISAIAPAVQLLVYVLIGAASLVILFGGVRLILGQSRGVVYLAAVLAIGGPLVGLLANALSFCNIGTFGMCLFGFLGGSAGSLVPLFVCIPFAIWAGITAANPNYGVDSE
jgi:hypothetical protein